MMMDRFFGNKNFIAVFIMNFIIILLEITCYLCHSYLNRLSFVSYLLK